MLVSNSLEYDCAFMPKVIKEVTQKYCDVHNIDILSDVAASQVKNKHKFNYYVVCMPQKICIFRAPFHHLTWKGTVDGMEGSIRCLVVCAANSRSHIVNNAASFATAARYNSTKVNVICT